MFQEEGKIEDFIAADWQGSAMHIESTLHQMAPYIGKMKSSMAAALVNRFSAKSETVYDPFCGAGTVALEAWAAGRNVIASDLNPYAVVLTKAKLFPPLNAEKAITEISNTEKEINHILNTTDLDTGEGFFSSWNPS